MVFAMRTLSIGRFVALVVVCMASLSAHAQSGRWWEQRVAQAGMPAGPMSPQAWQIGLGPYQLYNVQTGSSTKLDKATGRFSVRPTLLGGYAPLIPANQLAGPPRTITAPAILRTPAAVPVPGRSSSVPVDIIQPVSKGTLARVVAKGLKVLPVIGGIMTIRDLLEEANLAYDEATGQFRDTSAQADSGLWVIGDSVGALDSVCRSGVTALGYIFDRAEVQANPIFASCYGKSDPLAGSEVYQSAIRICCPTCFPHPICDSQSDNNSGTRPVVPLEDAIDRLEDAQDDKLIEAVNSLPNDPRVVDVIAREIQDEQDKPMFRWPARLDMLAPHTITVGDPLVTTTTNPDGFTVTQTTTTTATTAGDTITFNTTTVTNTYNQSGQLTGTTTTTTTPTDPSNPNSPQQEDLECGLPDKPPCKIDEEGTPEPPVNDAEQTVRDLFSEWQACIDDIQACLPQLPDISWTFSLPSGCSPIPLPGFEKWGLSSVDICPYQPMIHNIMSMLWAAAGLFGAISIISRRRTSE